MPYAPSTLSLEITAQTPVCSNATLPGASDYSSNAASDVAISSPTSLVRVSQEVPMLAVELHDQTTPTNPKKQSSLAGTDFLPSMSARRLASNKPFLQSNLQLPKRPFLKRAGSSGSSFGASPLPTSAVTLSYRDLFSKIACGTPPMTPVDQIASTPQEPPAPGKVPAKRQHPTLPKAACDVHRPLISPASPLPQAGKGVTGDLTTHKASVSRPRRLSYSTTVKANPRPEASTTTFLASSAFTGGVRALDSPALI